MIHDDQLMFDGDATFVSLVSVLKLISTYTWLYTPA